MRIGLRPMDGDERKLLLAQQLGANSCSLDGRFVPQFEEDGYLSVEFLRRMRERYERHNLEMSGFALGGKVVKNQLLGLPERERDVENVCRTLRTMGEVYADAPPERSPVLIIDQQVTFWAGAAEGGRYLPTGPGGTRLFHRDPSRFPTDRPAGEVTAEQVWERMAFLYERLIPVAEEAGILLATHPNDPPLEYFRGVHQVLTGLGGFAEFIERFPSPNNGLLLCLGCMAEAGEDIPEVIRYFGTRNRIFYVHFRNIRGVAAQYDEVYPDEGQTDMRAALLALAETGYTGSIVPDHHFGFTGDGFIGADGRPIRGALPVTSWAFQVGYVRGLLQGTQTFRCVPDPQSRISPQ